MHWASLPSFPDVGFGAWVLGVALFKTGNSSSTASELRALSLQCNRCSENEFEPTAKHETPSLKT